MKDVFNNISFSIPVTSLKVWHLLFPQSTEESICKINEMISSDPWSLPLLECLTFSGSLCLFLGLI
jgi:hypothetical protein